MWLLMIVSHVSIIMKRISVYCSIFVGEYIDVYKYEIISRVEQISHSFIWTFEIFEASKYSNNYPSVALC